MARPASPTRRPNIVQTGFIFMETNLKNILIRNGISPSYHRLKIFEFLVGSRSHPTVDIIYSEIIRQIPTLSKTTVYNTLKTLAEKGLLSPLTIEDTEVRYDADISFHGHFKCQSCGTLYDIDLGPLKTGNKLAAAKKIEGHLITEKQVYFKGICRKCLK